MEAWGIKAISIGSLIDEDQPMIWRGPMVMTALTQLIYDVVWAPLDVLIVDMPPGTGDAQLTLGSARAAGRRRHRLHAARHRARSTRARALRCSRKRMSPFSASSKT